MGIATGTQAQAKGESAFLKVALAAGAMLAGLLLGAGVGLGLSMNLLIASIIGPFALLTTFLWPGWATPVYIVLVYADLLSILVRYHGMPPLARFAGFLILVAVVGRRLVRRERLTGDPMTIWLVAYGVLLSLGLFYAQSPDLVATELIEFVRNFITYIVAINALVELKHVRGALGALLAMGALLAALTVYQTVTGNFDNDFGGLAQAKVTGITEVIDAPRPGGTVGDANFYGQGLLILVPVAFYFTLRAKHPATRLAGGLAGLLLVAAVVFTYSRGDTLALAAVLLAAAVYKRPPIHLVLGGLIALAVMLSFLPSTYYERVGTLLDVLSGNQQAIAGESSLLGRAGAASAAISMFADYPILGVGRSNYPLHELDYIEGTNLASKSTGIPPHDLYLEVAAEQGVAGILVMGGILVTTFMTLAKTRRAFLSAGDPSSAELAVWLSIGLFGYLVSSLFLHGAFLYMLWLQVTLAVALYHVGALAEVTARFSRTSPIGRAIRVREERPPGPAEVVGILTTKALSSPRTTPWPAIRRVLQGILAVLAAAGIIGLASIYALPAQRGTIEPQPLGLVLPAPQQAAGPGATTSPVTGYMVSNLFLVFWQSHGGVEVLGYPVGPEILEGGDDTRLYRVQYFERVRLEYHPDNPAGQQVEVGKLGAEVSRTGQVATELPPGLLGTPVLLGAGKPGVPPLFAAFWERTGEPVIGYPVSPVMVDTLPGGEQLFTQYFERARLEYHPEKPAGQEVVISNLGSQVYERRYGGK